MTIGVIQYITDEESTSKNGLRSMLPMMSVALHWIPHVPDLQILPNGTVSTEIIKFKLNQHRHFQMMSSLLEVSLEREVGEIVSLS